MEEFVPSECSAYWDDPTPETHGSPAANAEYARASVDPPHWIRTRTDLLLGLMTAVFCPDDGRSESDLWLGVRDPFAMAYLAEVSHGPISIPRESKTVRDG
jgi:hypothetical protein